MRALILILAAAPLVACSVASGSDAGNKGIPGSGSGTTRSYAVSDFTSVALTGSDDVRVRIGSGFSVVAEGPAEVLDKLKIERDGDTLKVGRQSHMGFSWGSGKGATITVTMPAIHAAALTGSGDMSVERAEGDSFKASATGSGSLDIAAMAVKTGNFSVTGSGDIRAAGKADTLSMSIAGSGDIKARGLEASSADVSVMGSGSVDAIVNGAARINLMGSGDIDLGPKAQCTTTKMGSGDVRCGG